MTDTWDEARLQQYINDEVQENLSLEYKRANSLNPKDPKWLNELTKDVSAMANSAGGVLIYGIAEKDDKPVELDPVDKTQFFRERLDQFLASNIKPRIDGLIIYPVPISSHPNHVAYVLDIPQSNTAHQANDKRYHKRLNTTTAWMEDYEIRDVMGRGQHPKIELEFEFLLSTFILEGNGEVIQKTDTYLRVVAINRGSVYTKYLNAYFTIPKYILPIPKRSFGEQPSGEEYYTLELRQEHETRYEDNTVREVVDVEFSLHGGITKYGPSRYDPILPERWHTWLIDVRNDIERAYLEDLILGWTIFADNAPKLTGKTLLTEIEFVEEVDKEYR